MTNDDPTLSALHASRRKFLELVDTIRPDLHRYCARMTGSIADGEDVVQDTLARAYYALSQLDELPALRPWLFRIAHHRAIDHLRRYDRRMVESLDVVESLVEAPSSDPEEARATEEAVRAAITRFVELAPAQRSCVVLKDVLGHSIDEIAGLLEMTEPAVKAALHRGRARLRRPSSAAAEPPRPTASPVVTRYAALFNARDWDGVRAMLADDVRLDLVSRLQRAGRRAVGSYFTNYDAAHDWWLVPAWLDRREVLAVLRDRRDRQPGYFVELDLVDHDRICAIRDYRYVAYIAREAAFTLPWTAAAEAVQAEWPPEGDSHNG